MDVWRTAVEAFGVLPTIIGCASALGCLIVCAIALRRFLPKMPNVEAGHYLRVDFPNDSPATTNTDKAALRVRGAREISPARAARTIAPVQIIQSAQQNNYPFRKFGDELRLVRLLKRETILGLAEGLGRTATYISEIEQGQLLPTDEEFSKIISTLNLSKGEIARLIRRMR